MTHRGKNLIYRMYSGTWSRYCSNTKQHLYRGLLSEALRVGDECCKSLAMHIRWLYAFDSTNAHRQHRQWLVNDDFICHQFYERHMYIPSATIREKVETALGRELKKN